MSEFQALLFVVNEHFWRYSHERSASLYFKEKIARDGEPFSRQLLCKYGGIPLN
jgi:hypothetical protein